MLLVVIGVHRSAQAQLPASGTEPEKRRYSPYETERIRRALLRVGGALDPEPEGKRIESIEVVTLPVFEPEDAVPQFLNWFHVTTQSYVIEREVLFRIGSPYNRRRSDEIERNLRDLYLFSVVLALPVRGSTEHSVRYVVLTKDIWSLRVGWDGRINKGVLEYLSMQPTERNLFGTGRQLFGALSFQRRIYSVGAGFVEPRLAGSRTRISLRADAVVSCDKGEVEGSSGSFVYSRPLYETTTPWSYSTSVSWSNGRAQLPVAGNLVGAICSAPSVEEYAATFENGKTVLLPNQYLYDSQGFNQTFTRSYGYRYKTNLSFGVEASRVAYAADDLSRVRTGPSENPDELTPAEQFSGVRSYLRRIPTSDMRLSPFFQVQAYENDFRRDINFETLALQEDFRLGHIATLRLYPALKSVGSARDLLGVEASVSYATAVRSGYAKLSVSHDVQISRPESTDASLALGFRFTSPHLPLGRFVYDARLVDHYQNYRNSAAVLGSTTRLRGYQSVAVAGAHYVISNLEFRTRPVQIFSAQLAGVVFHDMGDAFDAFGRLDLLHAVGGGIRFLAPQLDRDVFRIDIGTPMPFDAPRGELTVIATFGQAFGLP
jgi:hypothetical protein